MSRRIVGAMVVAALCVLPARASAQETPERVMERYFATFQTGDFAGNAAMMDPAALEELKAAMVGLANLAGPESAEQMEEMFSVHSPDELKALSAPALYERMLASVLRGEMRELLSGATIRVMGHVMEGDTAHVVYRMNMTARGTSINQVQVAPLVQVGGAWKVLLTGSFASMIGAVPAPGAAPGQD
ncbi:hypothetical protein [Longimicrobium terrae]|uniref:DUF4440 domain-containing protein n=1 Tax=Longimicrobium terrae TaxID=1639882 RepID=A0A841H037_9BACT|nr:hypothetical protein [Longimicrobium terrae]MBB4637025.1 hypothetical protein [Longimicrobium terrae]MBB6071367.1 hypothetical protein [Longimicrobium terrae]NNC31414.1 hypothetical protein [Longimicrobium terrae]